MQTNETYSQLRDIAVARRSCRRFTDIPVTRQTVGDILEIARIAPSAVNRQPWMFLCVDSSPEMEPQRRAIFEAYDRPWIRTATAFIICCADHSESWHRDDGKDHADIDIAIATEHICLAATALGIGSCWVCNFNTEVIRKSFDIPANLEPCVIVPLGYPDGSSEVVYRPFARKPLNQIMRWGKF